MSEYSPVRPGIEMGSRWAVRFLAGGLLAIFAVTGLGGFSALTESLGLPSMVSSAMATPTPPEPTDDPEEEDEEDPPETERPAEEEGLVRLLDLSRSTSDFFATMSSPTAESDGTVEELWRPIANDVNVGSAGSLLGYTQGGWPCGSATSSEMTCSIDALPGFEANSDGVYSSGFGASAQRYAQFGATLNGMGLDNSHSSPNSPPLQKGAGMIMYALFWVATAIGGLFGIILQVLQMFNPFNIVVASVGSLLPGSNSGVSSGSLPGAFAGLENFFGMLYGWSLEMGFLITIPLMILLLVLFVLLGKGKSDPKERNKKFKQLLIRVCFMVVGVPILGVLYTSTLDQMSHMIRDGNDGGPAQIVASTFVDFESWAINTRLQVPDDAVIQWNPNTQQPTAESMVNVRGTAKSINAMANPGVGLEGLDIAGGSSALQGSDLRGVSSWTLGDMGGRVGVNGIEDEREGLLGDMFNLDGIAWGTNMIERYMDGDYISGADFQTVWAGGVGSQMQSSNGDLAREDVAAWFEAPYNSGQSMAAMDGSEELLPTNNPALMTNGGLKAHYGISSTQANCEDEGGLNVCLEFTSDGNPLNANGVVPLITNANGPSEGNMSPTAMYNYLDTSFTPTSLTVYNPEATSTTNSRSYHAAVTTVGGGVMGPMYIVHGIILLGAFSLIGIVYSFGMLLSSIKRTVQLLMAMPIAVFGSLAFISRAILLTFAMIIEVLGTIMLYILAQYLLAGIPAIIEAPIVMLRDTANVGLWGELVGRMTNLAIWPFIGTLVGIIGGIVAIVMSLRMRKTVLRGINEVVTNLVNKLIGIEGGSQEQQGGGALGSIMPMAAMAMGMNAGRGGGGDVEADSSGDGNPGNPDDLSDTDSSGTPTIGGDDVGNAGDGSGSATNVGYTGRNHDGDQASAGEVPTGESDESGAEAALLTSSGDGLSTDLSAAGGGTAPGGDSPVDADISADGDQNQFHGDEDGSTPAGIQTASYEGGPTDPDVADGSDAGQSNLGADGPVDSGTVESGTVESDAVESGTADSGTLGTSGVDPLDSSSGVQPLNEDGPVEGQSPQVDGQDQSGLESATESQSDGQQGQPQIVPSSGADAGSGPVEGQSPQVDSSDQSGLESATENQPDGQQGQPQISGVQPSDSSSGIGADEQMQADQPDGQQGQPQISGIQPINENGPVEGQSPQVDSSDQSGLESATENQPDGQQGQPQIVPSSGADAGSGQSAPSTGGQAPSQTGVDEQMQADQPQSSGIDPSDSSSGIQPINEDGSVEGQSPQVDGSGQSGLESATGNQPDGTGAQMHPTGSSPQGVSPQGAVDGQTGADEQMQADQPDAGSGQPLIVPSSGADAGSGQSLTDRIEQQQSGQSGSDANGQTPTPSGSSDPNQPVPGGFEPERFEQNQSSQQPVQDGTGGMFSGGFLSGLNQASQQWAADQGQGQGVTPGPEPVRGDMPIVVDNDRSQTTHSDVNNVRPATFTSSDFQQPQTPGVPGQGSGQSLTDRLRDPSQNGFGGFGNSDDRDIEDLLGGRASDLESDIQGTTGSDEDPGEDGDSSPVVRV